MVSKVRSASSALTEEPPAKRRKLPLGEEAPQLPEGFKDREKARTCMASFAATKKLVIYEGPKLGLTKEDIKAWHARQGILGYEEVNSLVMQVLDRWDTYSAKIVPVKLSVRVVKRCTEVRALQMKLKEICTRRFFLLSEGWGEIGKQVALCTAYPDQERFFAEPQVHRVRHILKMAKEEGELLARMQTNPEIGFETLIPEVDRQGDKFKDALSKGQEMRQKYDKEKSKDLCIWDPVDAVYIKVAKAKLKNASDQARVTAKAIDLKAIKIACDFTSDLHQIFLINRTYLRQMQAAIIFACKAYTELSSGLVLEE